MAQEPSKIVRMYDVNQEKLDEAVQVWVELILEMASEEKLVDIKKQLDARLEKT